ncbi:hypothetical protein [Demequina sp. NBRC 110056]|uniref:hypothetical protein n=1 Tax=Demequina sp. NBRC 110056 TaxID=1570345 RepID=UPI00117ECEAB|nr:hypothetical protein [Demequina sp. NBRC 110056]
MAPADISNAPARAHANHGISRRRVLHGAAWIAPAITVATAIPAAASSPETSAPQRSVDVQGNWLVFNGVELSNVNSGVGRAQYVFGMGFRVWNDQAAFNGSGVQAWQVSTAQEFQTWPITYKLEIRNAAGTVVHTTSETRDLATPNGDGGWNSGHVDLNLGASGTYTMKVSISSSKIALVNGKTFMALPWSQEVTKSIT